MQSSPRGSGSKITDALIESLSIEQLERVMHAKADGAWHLHELTQDMQLSHFVLFSSRASVGGGPYIVEEAYPLAAIERKWA